MTFFDEKLVDRPVQEVFESMLAVGRSGGLGQYFSGSVARPNPGEVIKTVIPLQPDTANELGTARLVEYRPYDRIVLSQETPWAARTVFRFTATETGTRIRTYTSVPTDTVEWVADRIAHEDGSGADRDTGARNIALVTSLSGHSGLFGRSAVNCALLAEEAINADGGILGEQIRVVVIDDRSDPEVGARELLRFDENLSIDAAIGVHSSATSRAVVASGWATRKPYIFAPLSESETDWEGLLTLGESEHDQLDLAIPYLSSLYRERSRWLLIGSDFSWPRRLNAYAASLIAQHGGSVVDEIYVDPTHLSFDELVARVDEMSPDFVVSSLVGWSSIAFEESMFTRGLRDRISTLSMLMDECTRELLGEAGVGIWSSMSYFQDLDSAENRSFRQLYRKRFGPYAPPISAIAESAYDALILLAKAANHIGSIEPAAIRCALGDVYVSGPRGPVHVRSDGRLDQPMYLAQATRDGWSIQAHRSSETNDHKVLPIA